MRRAPGLHLYAPRLTLESAGPVSRRGRKKMLGLSLVAAIALAAAVPLVRPRCVDLRGTETLSVPLARLAAGAVRRFCYRDSAGERLRFLLARGADGRVHAVFDACRQCYKFHQGYDVAHGMLICRLCGNRYSVDHMDRGEASCVPVTLPHRENAGRVTIKVSDVKSGTGLF